MYAALITILSLRFIPVYCHCFRSIILWLWFFDADIGTRIDQRQLHSLTRQHNDQVRHYHAVEAARDTHRLNRRNAARKLDLDYRYIVENEIVL